ncbi:proline-rich transmembrane protein 1-like isoform X2 [Mercenaria mercenaria]|uniref:proline-rich transmembrane protein 1-like isoform X2 n=1 Tax=Mercenaria mercenaria TaxID=6596 RepID=UPI00234F5B5A|nr:proline-rich transmembrane protein 1-like isoform X2 [Mercenaria mercenaria]
MADQTGYDQPGDGYTDKYPRYREEEPPPYQFVGTQQPVDFVHTPFSHQPYVVSDQPQHDRTLIIQTRPPNYMIPSILACLCCFWPTGLCAIYYANEANNMALAGDYVGAIRMANISRNMMVFSVVVGIFWITVLIVINAV